MIEAKPENLIGDRAYDSDPLDVELRPVAGRHQCWLQCHGRLDPVWLSKEPRALAGRLRRAQTPLRALGI